MRLGYFLLFSLVLSVPLASLAQRPINQHPVIAPEDDKDKSEWVEDAVTPPPYPQDKDLIPVAMAATSNEFFVDSKSVAIGKDSVIRYTMLIRSNAGALNVTHEGIRCGTREKKLYHIGRSDGTWSAARNPKWGEVAESGAMTYQKILMNDFFCPKKSSVKSVAEAVSALRAGYHPNVRTKAGR